MFYLSSGPCPDFQFDFCCFSKYACSGVGGVWEMQTNAYEGWVGQAFETVLEKGRDSSLSFCFIFGMWSDIILGFI